ncbi:MAG TPA: hypothetical protein VFZ91_09665 [Allosphingosinicella sp.]
MKRMIILTAAAAALSGCDRTDDRAPHGPGQGRYLGVGIYDAGQMWQELSGGEQPKDPKAATLADDTEIIVVVDSVTGEVRQCGNLSARCISMNPWRGRAGTTPASLERHAAELARDSEAEAQNVAAKPRP